MNSLFLLTNVTLPLGIYAFGSQRSGNITGAGIDGPAAHPAHFAPFEPKACPLLFPEVISQTANWHSLLIAPIEAST